MKTANLNDHVVKAPPYRPNRWDWVALHIDFILVPAIVAAAIILIRSI